MSSFIVNTTSFNETLSLPPRNKWMTTMRDELESFNKPNLGTGWLSSNRKPIGNKWVFKVNVMLIDLLTNINQVL